MASPEHAWQAYIPEAQEEKPVCSYACMREMERRAGRCTAMELAGTEAQEEQAQTQGGEAVCTDADELFALMRQKELLEHQLMPLTRMIERRYEQKRVKKMSARERKELFDREKQLMRRLGDVNRRIREVKDHGWKNGK